MWTQTFDHTWLNMQSVNYRTTLCRHQVLVYIHIQHTWHDTRVEHLFVLTNNQLQLWSDLLQLCSSSVTIVWNRQQPYNQLLQWGVSTSSLKYSIHHTIMYPVNVQHLEWLVSFNGSFHLLQECCIDHFLHKQKTVVATNKSSQPHDTHTLPHIVYAYPHACQQAHPHDSPCRYLREECCKYIVNIMWWNTESALEWVHEVHAVSSVTLYMLYYQ